MITIVCILYSITESFADFLGVHILSPAAIDQPTRPSEYAAGPVPSIEDFQSLWTAWDVATKTMIPREDLLSKPIKLRNACVFYLGHRKLTASLQCSCRLYFGFLRVAETHYDHWEIHEVPR